MSLRKSISALAALVALVVLIGCSGEPSGRSNATEPDAQGKGKAEAPGFDPNK